MRLGGLLVTKAEEFFFCVEVRTKGLSVAMAREPSPIAIRSIAMRNAAGFKQVRPRLLLMNRSGKNSIAIFILSLRGLIFVATGGHGNLGPTVYPRTAIKNATPRFRCYRVNSVLSH